MYIYMYIYMSYPYKSNYMLACQMPLDGPEADLTSWLVVLDTLPNRNNYGSANDQKHTTYIKIPSSNQARQWNITEL